MVLSITDEKLTDENGIRDTYVSNKAMKITLNNSLMKYCGAIPKKDVFIAKVVFCHVHFQEATYFTRCPTSW
jgi:hypothetical protein